MVAYLEVALEDGDPALIAATLSDIARARGMTKVAADAGLGRERLYKALSPNGGAKFAFVLRVMQALGLGLRLSAVKAH
jgi:probable addiction module antidote protein